MTRPEIKWEQHGSMWRLLVNGWTRGTLFHEPECREYFLYMQDASRGRIWSEMTSGNRRDLMRAAERIWRARG